jgi:putative membrane protein
MNKGAEQDPRVYFAAERTFLAWIRTGLGLIGIGFAVSRFGLFFRQLSASESHWPTRATGLSVWSGVTLVALGVIVILSSVLRHFQLIRELNSGTWIPGRVSRDAVALGLLFGGTWVGRLKSLLSDQARCCRASRQMESAALIASVRNGTAWRPSCCHHSCISDKTPKSMNGGAMTAAWPNGE